MMTTATETRIACRYTQRDLHDLRRAAGLWWALLETNLTNTQGGLSQPEHDLHDACGLILTRIRHGPLGELQMRDVQMALDEAELTPCSADDLRDASRAGRERDD